MGDLLFVVIIVAFFVLAAGFVRICDRIIGPDLELTDSSPGPAPGLDVVEVDVESAAGAPR